MLFLSPAVADDAAAAYIPETLKVSGVVLVEQPTEDPRDPDGPKLGNSAIVNGKIWWEGQTIKVKKTADEDDDSWVTLTLTKVEKAKGKRGSVLTFTVELTRHLDKPTFTIAS
jgi:hypothetical protein